MPELPDVEVFRRYFDAHAAGRAVADLTTDAPRLVADTKPEALAGLLSGRRLGEGYRHGKHLYIPVTGIDGWLAVHFGMTGHFRHVPAGEALPRHGHLVLVLAGGDRLALVIPRKLGHVRWVTDLAANLTDLGPDPWAMTFEGFREQTEGRRGQVKCWLMDQSAIAGIGNVYSDEILLHAGIHPKHRLESLDEAALQRIHGAMAHVLAEAVAAEVDPDRMPADLLVPRRGKGAHCPLCGSAMETLKACGRTAYRCPCCQPEPA